MIDDDDVHNFWAQAIISFACYQISFRISKDMAMNSKDMKATEMKAMKEMKVMKEMKAKMDKASKKEMRAMKEMKAKMDKASKDENEDDKASRERGFQGGSSEFADLMRPLFKKYGKHAFTYDEAKECDDTKIDQKAMRKASHALKVLKDGSNDKMTFIRSTVKDGFALIADEFFESWGMRDGLKASWVTSYERRTMNICRAYNRSRTKHWFSSLIDDADDAKRGADEAHEENDEAKHKRRMKIIQSDKQHKEKHDADIGSYIFGWAKSPNQCAWRMKKDDPNKRKDPTMKYENFTGDPMNPIVAIWPDGMKKEIHQMTEGEYEKNKSMKRGDQQAIERPSYYDSMHPLQVFCLLR